MARKKITVIGAGNVGTSIAAYASAQELGNLVLVDIREGIPEGEGLDMYEAAAALDSDTKVVGTNDYEPTRGSDVLVITAGIPRKPGMSRDDLLSTNVKIVGEVAEKSAKLSPDAIMIVISNPLDAMVYTAWKKSGFAPRRVVGMAGVLDTARLRSFLAQEIGVSVKDVYALVLGSHGDTMVPLTRYCSVGGIPVTNFISRASGWKKSCKGLAGRRGNRSVAQDRERTPRAWGLGCADDSFNSFGQEAPAACGRLFGRRIRRKRDFCWRSGDSWG